MMLGGNPAAGSSPTTNLLYSGEQFDTNSQNYYLRARYYDPSNGRFNRVDPYAGNQQDPQSLHKYLYCHANPANGIDPSGMITLVETMIVISVITVLSGIIGGVISKKAGGSFWYGALFGGSIGFIISHTAFWQLHKLPLVIAQGIGGGLISALSKRLAHYQNNLLDISVGSWDDKSYVDPFMKGFAWAAAAEAFGGYVGSEVIVALATSILADITDLICNGVPLGDTWSDVLIDIVANTLISVITTAYMNALVPSELEGLGEVPFAILKSWICGIFAIPVNSILCMGKDAIKSEEL